MNDQTKLKPDKTLFNYARYSTMAIQMIVVVCIGVFSGIRIDHWLHWKFPAFTLFLALLSIIIALYISVKDILKKKTDKE